MKKIKWLKQNPSLTAKQEKIDNKFSKRYAWESRLKKEWIKAQIKLNQHPNIVEEVDLQEQNNQTLHPTLMEDTVLQYLGMDNEIWINAKMTSVTDLAAAANLKN